MKKNLTELICILDMSGSMNSLVNDTIGGYNSLIEKQKKEEGEAYVTTVLFDNRYIMFQDHINIQDVNPLTTADYRPMGMTALLDAIGRTINSVGARLNETPEEERPEKVIVTITTDGMENASQEFTKTQIKEMIEHQQSKYSWVFMFLGANMDAVSEASSLGINTDFARTYTANEWGTESVYSSLSNSISNIRDQAFSFDTNSASYKAVMDELDKVE